MLWRIIRKPNPFIRNIIKKNCSPFEILIVIAHSNIKKCDAEKF
jgi:hypothetical protein